MFERPSLCKEQSRWSFFWGVLISHPLGPAEPPFFLPRPLTTFSRKKSSISPLQRLSENLVWRSALPWAISFYISSQIPERSVEYGALQVNKWAFGGPQGHKPATMSSVPSWSCPWLPGSVSPRTVPLGLFLPFFWFLQGEKGDLGLMGLPGSRGPMGPKVSVLVQMGVPRSSH